MRGGRNGGKEGKGRGKEELDRERWKEGMGEEGMKRGRWKEGMGKGGKRRDGGEAR